MAKSSATQRDGLWLATLRDERDKQEAAIRAAYPAALAEAFIARVRRAAQAGADSLYTSGTEGQGLAELFEP